MPKLPTCTIRYLRFPARQELPEGYEVPAEKGKYCPVSVAVAVAVAVWFSETVF
jgi:hypothetical protein